MVDIEKLHDAIKDSGLTIPAVARKAGMPERTLYNRLKGIGDITVDEMLGLSKALGLKVSQRDNIFF